jgi:DNA-binding CsgD family transcriptional regulator/ligand-binding sensor protein
MTKNVTAKEWVNFIGKEKLQSFQDDFARNHNIGICFLDLDNNELVVHSKGSLLCYEVLKQNKKVCMEEHSVAVKQIFKNGKAGEFTCSMGLAYFMCPVYWNKQLIGYGYGGAATYKDSPVPERLRIKFKIPVFTRSEFHAISQTFANVISLLNIDCNKVYKKAEETAAAGNTITDARLTDREKQIAEQVCRGLNNKQIAEALFISEKTVKTHVSNILAKLNVKDRLHLVLQKNELQQLQEK